MVDVAAEGSADDRVPFQLLQGFGQASRQAGNVVAFPFRLAHAIDVFRNGVGGQDLVVDPVQACHEDDGQGQVGVAGRVGAPELDPGSLAPDGGDPDEGAPVPFRPGDVNGGLVTGHQAFIGVDQRVGDGCISPGVLHQAPDEVEGHIAQLILGVGVIEGIAAILEKGQIYVHAGAADAVKGLGHKGGVEIVLGGYGFDHEAKGDHIVGGAEGIGIAEVYLVLARGHLMVGRLHLKAHLLQGQDHVPPGIFPHVHGDQVEVAGPVAGDGGGLAPVIPAKEKELRLRAGVQGIPPGGRFGHGPFQGAPGAAGKGLAIVGVDIADNPGGGGAVADGPGQDGKGGKVGAQCHVRFLDAGKALDGGAVKHNPAVQGRFQLIAGNGDIFGNPLDIGKLQHDKADLIFFD